MAAQDAELKLKVSLDLAFFRQQLTGLGQAAAGYNVPVQVQFKKESIVSQFRLLSLYLGRKTFDVKITSRTLEGLAGKVETLHGQLKALKDEKIDLDVNINASVPKFGRDKAKKIRAQIRRDILSEGGQIPLDTKLNLPNVATFVKNLSKQAQIVVGLKNGATGKEVQNVLDAIQGRIEANQKIKQGGGKLRVPVSVKPGINNEDIAAFKTAVQSKLGGITVKIKAELEGVATGKSGFATGKTGYAGLEEYMRTQGTALPRLEDIAGKVRREEFRTAISGQGITKLKDIARQVGVEGFSKYKSENAAQLIDKLVQEASIEAITKYLDIKAVMRNPNREPLRQVLDTFARGIFHMLGIDPASLKQARAATIQSATRTMQAAQTPPTASARLLPAQTQRTAISQGVEGIYRNLLGGAGGGAPGGVLVDTKRIYAALQKNLNEILQRQFAVIEVDVSGPFMDLKSAMNAFAYLAQSLRDAETRAKQAQVGAAVSSLLQKVTNALRLAEAQAVIPVSVKDITARPQEPQFRPGSRVPLTMAPQRALPAAGGTTPRGQMRFNAVSGGAVLGQPQFMRAPSIPAPIGRGGGGMQPPSRGGGGGIGGFGRGMGNINLPGANTIRELGNEFGNATKQVLLFGTAYKALAFLTSFPMQVGQAVGALQSFNNTLKAVSPTAQEAKASNDLILSLVEKYNVPLQSARDGFTKLYASMAPAGFKGEEIRNIFTGISKATAAFGLSADQVDRVNYAFAQMASKGQVMSEELKGQLGDVLPGAMAIFAEAAGFKGPDAIQKFSKALEDGAYKGEAMKVLLQNVGVVMNKEFGPGAEGAARTFQGAINRIQNSMTLLYESFQPVAMGFLNSVVTPLTAGIKTITDGFNSFFTQTAAKTSGGFALAQELEKLRPAFEGIKQNVASVIAILGQMAKVGLELGKILLQIAGSPLIGYLARVYAIILPLNIALGVMRGLWASNAIQLLVFQARIIAGTSTLSAFRSMMQTTGMTATATGAAIRGAFASTVIGVVLVGVGLLIEKFMSMNAALEETKNKALGAAQAIRAMSSTEARAEEFGASRAVKMLENISTRRGISAGKTGMSEQQNLVAVNESERAFLEGRGIPIQKNPIFGGGLVDRSMIGGYIQQQQGLKREAEYRQRQSKFDEQQARTPAALQPIPPSAGDQKAQNAKVQNLESLESLADQLAKARTEGEIERANILFEHKKKLLDMQFAYEESGADEIQQTRIKFAKELSDVLINYEEQVFKARTEIQKAAGSVAPGNRPPNAPKGQAPYGPISQFGAGANSGLQIGQQVGSLTPARPVSGSERRDFVAAASAYQAQLTETIRITKALEEATKKYALTIKQQIDTIFPVAQLTLQNKLLAMRNKAELRGIPKEVIDLEQELYMTREKSTAVLEELKKEFDAAVATYDKYTKMQQEGITLTKTQQTELEKATIIVNGYGDSASYAADKFQEFTTAQLESTIASLKHADAMKSMEETANRINQTVEGVTGTYKDLFKEIAKGTNSVEALKKAQDALADQFLTMFFDFAMKPVEDFFKKTLGSIFKVPNEEETRANMIKKLEEQLAKQQEIANNTKRTADNTQPGGGGAPGAAPPRQSANTIRPSMPSSNPQDASYQQGGAASLAQELPLSSFTSISESLGTLTDSATAYAEKLKTVTVDSWETVKLGGQIAEDAKNNGDKLKESLGKATQAVGIAAGAIMGIAAGISQIKEGGTSNVLGGIGSILLSIGGAIGGFGNVFGWKGFANGGVAKGGLVPFRAFANGGTVGGPTLGLMGEGKYNEAIVPLPDGRSIPVRLNSSSIREKMTSQAASPVLNMSFQTTNIGGTEYVSRDQLEQAMAQTRKLAANDGARRGMGMTLDRLQQSPSTRSRLGMR